MYSFLLHLSFYLIIILKGKARGFLKLLSLYFLLAFNFHFASTNESIYSRYEPQYSQTQQKQASHEFKKKKIV